MTDQHEDCPAELRDAFAHNDIEVTVSTLPPLVDTDWSRRWTCPHGVPLWVEPTGEQHAAWAAEGRESP